MRLSPAILLTAAITLSTAYASQGTVAPKSFDNAPSAPAKSNTPGVEFIDPETGAALKDGAVLIGSEFKIAFRLTGQGMRLHPAGELIPNTGHHHLIVNGKPIPKGQVVPADAKHLHFGKAQEETMLKLEPGKHTLTLQFADGAHVSYGPELAKTITVTVRAR